MRIIPAPKEIIEKDGAFIFNKNIGIFAEETIKNNFLDFCQKVLGLVIDSGRGIAFVKKDGFALEGYSIDISQSSIVVYASTDNGLFYGAQTLKQIFFEYYDKKNDLAKIPCVTINDEPRFSYRGFMFDCARHFFPIEVVKSYIDAMSIIKMNVFHWHLTEDQGWRIEIARYPRLTDIGSRRRCTMHDDVPHGGYFTKDDVREVVEYARARFITVIPEFDMPGHTRAAIASYPELGCAGTAVDVSTKFGIHKEILCAGNEKSYEFIKDVLSEFAEMFPGDYIHLGGDEAIKLEWYKCSKCQQKIKELGLKNEEELQAYMTEMAVNHVKSLNKTAICWNESANSGKLESSVVLQYWSDGKKALNVIREVKAGRKIIVSRFSPYYLDYPYAMHSLKSAYEFEPVFSGIENYEKNVLGVEAPIWTEYVADTNLLAYRVFPRLTAVAETGWSQKGNRDYSSFAFVLNGVSSLIEKQTGIKMTLAKKCNPNIFAKPFIIAKFGSQMLDKEMIKRSMVANREVKKMRALRKNEVIK